MELSKLKDKIAKLKAMAACTGPEADNAKRLIQRLIDKYEIKPEDVQDEPKKPMRVRLHRLKKFGILLAKYCRLKFHTISGEPDYIVIWVDSDEYRLYYELYDEMKHIFNKKENELRKEAKANGYGNRWKNDMLQSFMFGYVTSNYPTPANLCQICYVGTIVNMQCNHCRTVYSRGKYRKRSIIDSAYKDGLATNTKVLTQNKTAIGYSNG